MQTILNQLGELLLGSVPTVVFFLLLLAAYAVLVRRPLEKLLAERHARTGGAMEEAYAAIRSAEEKTERYEAQLRDARASIFSARATRQQAATAARDKALAEAREIAQQRIATAREGVEATGAEAKAQLEAGAGSLTQQIISAVLPQRKHAGVELAQ